MFIPIFIFYNSIVHQWNNYYSLSLISYIYFYSFAIISWLCPNPNYYEIKLIQVRT